ncbi:AAA family ATPase [Alienimonas californiensis]|nr:AAA family ATPase [Alienimonas californiensis]
MLAASLDPAVDRVEVLTDGDVPVLHFGWPGGSLPVAYQGEGVHAAFRIGLSLTALSGGVALLEEPEAHLHPAAMVLVAKAIINAVRSGTQVVLTTHSLEFIDRLVDEVGDDAELLTLFTVWLNDGRLMSARHDGDEVRFARGEIAEDLR